MQDFPLIVAIEIKPDRGEDAYAIFPESSLIEDSTDYCAIAVFDGLGGRSAGYDGLTGGQIASQIAAKQTDKFLKQWRGKITQESISELQYNIYQLLQQEANSKLKPSRLKGSLAQKRLCTTLAVASINEQNLTVDLAWIGDSRIYFLSPDQGLQQLTKDDIVVNKDAFEMIREDPPLSQYLTADMETEWQINFKSEQFQNKGCVLVCTDGCFQYVSAPWKFEQLLLETLNQSQTPEDWKNILLSYYNDFKQDDVSLILHPIAFTDFEDLNASYNERLAYLQSFNQEDETYESLSQKWQNYRVNYEAKLHLTDVDDDDLTVLDDFKDQEISEGEYLESDLLQDIDNEEVYSADNLIDHDNQTEISYQTSETVIYHNEDSYLSEDISQQIEELHQTALNYNAAQQVEQAIDCWQKILTLEPEYLKANYNLGIVYINKFERLFGTLSTEKTVIYQKAVDHLRKVIENNNDHDLQEKAITELSEFYQKYKGMDNPDVLELLGDIAENKNNLEDALKFFQECEQLYWKEFRRTRSPTSDQEHNRVNKKIKRVQNELDRLNSFYH